MYEKALPQRPPLNRIIDQMFNGERCLRGLKLGEELTSTAMPVNARESSSSLNDSDPCAGSMMWNFPRFTFPGPQSG